MYRYVPNLSIQHILDDKASYYSGTPYLRWEKVNRIIDMFDLPNTNNHLFHVLQGLKGFVYYDTRQLSVVPVRGILLPVQMFKVTKE